MTVYNYLTPDGKTVNNPYEYGADGQITQNNIWQGRADGDTGSAAANFNPGSPQPMSMPGVSTGGYGGASFGGGATSPSTYGPNPYLKDQANGIQSQVNQNLSQNIMPGIRSGAQANGQYGGSRQGIAEGVAAGNASGQLAGALAGLYGGAYNTDQANQTQRIGLANQYSLGMGNLALGNKQADNSYNLGLGGLGNAATAQNQNFYTQQRGQDLQQYQIGSGLYGSGVTGQTGIGASQYGVGQQAYQAPLNALQQYSNNLTPYTGLNSAQQQTVQGGGGASGALGGALAGGQIAKNLGFGSSTTGGAQAAFSGTSLGSSGFGSGLAYGNQDLGLYF